MNFYNPTVPNLQQMSFVMIAVKICNDQEVKALMKKYGHASFLIPSKEMHIFLHKELPQYTPSPKTYGLLIHEYEDIFCSNVSNSMYYYGISNPVLYHHWNEHRFVENILPCMMWEELISKKISSLPLPNSMKWKLMPLVRCICIEMEKWQKDHKDIFQFQSTDFQRNFCWNSQGRIDRVKTAKSLINDESLCITERYHLARLYFFVSDIISLGNKLDPLALFGVKEGYDHDEYNKKLWFFYMKTKTDEYLNRICRTSVCHPYNLRAYFSFFTPSEKTELLKLFMHNKSLNHEDLYLCLSQLEKNEQELILRLYSYEILQYYLVWPLQNEFLDVLKSLWPFISIEKCIDILCFIIYERIMIGWKDFDYVWLLKEFWRQTPNNFKELLKNHEVYQNLLPVISYELDNSFPNEVILENYKENDLKFHHVRIKYHISKMTNLINSWSFRKRII
ncbi:uncharacterized protein TNIN_417581 [Trichonephila inaurata madagascariensis]|uniref:Uncharacterized protein n=1 Tax=Trichonephila inaurata madagascariensis TaxID=2747483 RepID=A0A8X6X499_9ARAC|nr:uncharacterized protein TNIN_417581 [Trichonephila inaurata madagascariensis]